MARCLVCGHQNATLVTSYKCFHAPSRSLFRGRNIVRCSACALMYVDPVPTEEQLAQYYRDNYRENDHRIVPGKFPYDDPRYLSRARSLCDLIVEHVDTRQHSLSPRKVIEIGAGHGRVLHALRERRPDWSLFACEPDPKCQASLKRLGATAIPVFLADEQSLKAVSPHGPFDVLILSHVLEHLLDPVAALRTMARVLAPGGVLAIEIPHAPPQEVRSTSSHAPHLTFMTKETLKETIQRAEGSPRFIDTVGPRLGGFQPIYHRAATRAVQLLAPENLKARLRRSLDRRASHGPDLRDPACIPLKAFSEHGGEHRWALRAIVSFD